MDGMSEDVLLDGSRESTDHVGVDSSFLTSMRFDVAELCLNETGIDDRNGLMKEHCGRPHTPLTALIAAVIIILHALKAESGSNLEVSNPSDMERTSESYTYIQSQKSWDSYLLSLSEA